MDNTLFSIVDAKSAVACDFRGLSSQLEPKNYTQVFYACNTWGLMLMDIGVPVGYIYPLLDTVKHTGLRTVCSACFDVAESLLGDLDHVSMEGESFFKKRLTTPINSPIGSILDFIQEELTQSEEESVKLCLQFLLYLERFTYIGGADEEASIRKFLLVNETCRTAEYDWSFRPGSCILEHVHYELCRMLTPDHWDFRTSECGFSTGSVIEAMHSTEPARRSTLAKWGYLSQYVANVFGVQYPLPGGRWADRQYKHPVLTLVPKSFTSRRVIFPEDSFVNFYGHGLLEAFRRMLISNGTYRFINGGDQSVNRDFACIGSQTGEWATIDMSSASDSIGKALVFWCLPNWFRPIMHLVQSYFIDYRVKGNAATKKLFSLLTSGNPLTWDFESVWFLALGRVAASLCGSPNPDLDVFAYGDDLVVRADYYETTLQVLECFHHRINRRKSYGSGHFRESCGGWYYRGEDVTPVFWPRREVPDTKATLASVLVDLQHKAHTAGWGACASWLTDRVLDLYPKITRSSIGSNFGDLWDASCDGYHDTQYRHSAFVAETASCPHKWEHLAQYVAYQQYLVQGPLYVSDEDKEWGISTSRLENLMRYSTDKVVLRR